MGHPIIDNKTGFAAEVLYLTDEELRPLAVPVVKATFTIVDGSCQLADEQSPINTAGEYWGEDAETSSYKYEPEIAFFKPATDVVLVGHAYAARSGVTEMDVRLSVGPLRKTLRIFGDRAWVRSLGSIVTSRPLAFERVPLTYERAFGGTDTSHADRSLCQRDARNPVGTGFSLQLPEEGLRLPNLEDPSSLLRAFGDRPAPVGVGFTSPHWQPRAAWAGTCDEAWLASRAPLLPRDFDRRYFNSASAGLTAAGYLTCHEQVFAEGVSPSGPIRFALPGITPPKVTLALKDSADVELRTAFDTLVLDPDASRVQLLWRAHYVLRTGPHDVRTVRILAGSSSN